MRVVHAMGGDGAHGATGGRARRLCRHGAPAARVRDVKSMTAVAAFRKQGGENPTGWRQLLMLANQIQDPDLSAPPESSIPGLACNPMHAFLTFKRLALQVPPVQIHR